MSTENPNFLSVLDMNADDTVKPKHLPFGTYTLAFTSAKPATSRTKHTPGVQVIGTVVSIEPDVAPEAVEEFGGEAKIVGTRVYLDYWNSAKDKDKPEIKDNPLRFHLFLEKTMLNDPTGRAYSEVVQECIGHYFLAEQGQRVNEKTGEFMRPEITNTKPSVEDQAV